MVTPACVGNTAPPVTTRRAARCQLMRNRGMRAAPWIGSRSTRRIVNRRGSRSGTWSVSWSRSCGVSGSVQSIERLGEHASTGSVSPVIETMSVLSAWLNLGERSDEDS